MREYGKGRGEVRIYGGGERQCGGMLWVGERGGVRGRGGGGTGVVLMSCMCVVV